MAQIIKQPRYNFLRGAAFGSLRINKLKTLRSYVLQNCLPLEFAIFLIILKYTRISVSNNGNNIHFLIEGRLYNLSFLVHSSVHAL